MPSFYVHLSGEDIKDVQHLLYGTKPKADSKELSITLTKCPRCSFTLSPESSFCNKCGLALTAKGAMEYREKTQLIDKLVNAVTEDPMKRAKFLELIQS